MAVNQSGNNVPKRFRKGQVLTAQQMNQLADMLAMRINGGNGINVRTFSGRIVIEARDA